MRRLSVHEALGRLATGRATANRKGGDGRVAGISQMHLAKGWRVTVAWALAQHGIEGDEALACEKALRPVCVDAIAEHPTLTRPPGISLSLKRFAQRLVALVVPACADRHLGGVGVVEQRRRRLLGTKDVQSLESRGTLWAGAATGISQRGAQLAVVQVLDIADREHAHAVGRVVDDLVAELGRDREAVEDQRLNIAENVSLLERRKDAPQGPGVEAVSGNRQLASGSLKWSQRQRQGVR